jgi:hypothetical protein
VINDCLLSELFNIIDNLLHILEKFCSFFDVLIRNGAVHLLDQTFILYYQITFFIEFKKICLRNLVFLVFYLALLDPQGLDLAHHLGSLASC